MKLFLLVIILPLYAIAGTFAELGVGATVDSCIYQSWQRTNNITSINCSRDPLGYLALGYKFDNGLTIQVDHWSSLVQKDYGLNTVSIRYRFNFGDEDAKR